MIGSGANLTFMQFVENLTIPVLFMMLMLEWFNHSRAYPPGGLLGLLFSLNRSALTLLERQRALQNFSDEYRHYASLANRQHPPSTLFVRFCGELAIGFKRLLLQILQGRQPSMPHLAWCLYMAQHFLAQQLLRHYQLYQEPPAALWRDSHLLYWIGEHQECLDEHISAAFLPAPACTLRGLYQQALILALSNPFHLAEGESPLLFGALAPLAGLARLLPWDDEEESDGPIVDLGASQACLTYDQPPEGGSSQLRRLELGALLVALHEPAPLQTAVERELLERVRPHWLGRQQRRHDRSDLEGQCNLVIGLNDIHAQLLEKRPQHWWRDWRKRRRERWRWRILLLNSIIAAYRCLIRNASTWIKVNCSNKSANRPYIAIIIHCYIITTLMVVLNSTTVYGPSKISITC